MIGNSIICSSDFRKSSSQFNGRKSKSEHLESRKNGSSQFIRRKSKSENLDSRSQTSLSKLFSDDEERELLGIGFFTIFEAGVVVSGYGGNGIVLSRNVMTGEWSGPVAVGISGIGAGLLLGASVKSIVYLIYDYFTLRSIIGAEGGLIFGAGAGATVGRWNKEMGGNATYITSPKNLRSAGMGSNVALCRGIAGMYGAMSIEAGVCKSRDKLNAQFYGKKGLKGSDILLSGEKFDIPNSYNTRHSTVSNFQSKRMLEKIHSKLVSLCTRDGSEPFGSKYSDEDIGATLEELYADESYDCDDAPTKDEKKDEIVPLVTKVLTTPSPLVTRKKVMPTNDPAVS